MSEIRIRSIRPLPEPLPEDERVLWQRSPAWQPFSRRTFHLDKIGIYFLAVVAWVAGSAYLDANDWSAVLRSLTWAIPPALGVMLLLLGIAWLYARTTVYTITSKRVIIQSGLAVPSAVNLPFSKIQSADMKTFSDGSGDIELAMAGPRLLYSMLWPNVRFLRLNRPTPVMRAVPSPKSVAETLARAIAADQDPQSAVMPQARSDEQDDASPQSEMHRASAP